jgi:hypothetical protein
MNLLYASDDQRQSLEVVFKRAATDTSFRQQLLTQPRRAVQEVTGVKIPETYNIQFIETPRGVDALIPLPELIDEDVTLTEEELEAVAGGTDEEWCCGQCSDCSACSQCSVNSTELY